MGNPFYHASGVLSHLTNRISDKQISLKCAKYMNDPRFVEHGLNEYYKERGSLNSEIPSREELIGKKRLLREAGVAVITAFFPPVGHGSLLMAPALYQNNWTATNHIKKALEIGDEVKEKIEEGWSEEQIREWLKKLYR